MKIEGPGGTLDLSNSTMPHTLLNGGVRYGVMNIGVDVPQLILYPIHDYGLHRYSKGYLNGHIRLFVTPYGVTPDFTRLSWSDSGAIDSTDVEDLVYHLQDNGFYDIAQRLFEISIDPEATS